MNYYKIACPYYDPNTMDDRCGKPVVIDAWPAEQQTFWYPGSPEGFEVTSALCGHATVLEDEYYDEIIDRLSELERDAQEAAAEARYDAWLERQAEQAENFGRWD